MGGGNRKYCRNEREDAQPSAVCVLCSRVTWQHTSVPVGHAKTLLSRFELGSRDQVDAAMKAMEARVERCISDMKWRESNE